MVPALGADRCAVEGTERGARLAPGRALSVHLPLTARTPVPYASTPARNVPRVRLLTAETLAIVASNTTVSRTLIVSVN